jgi:hypothetical protein
MIRICTGWSPTGRLQYGERFMESFDKHWPHGVQLQVYTEEPHNTPRGSTKSLWRIPGAVEFAARHRDNGLMNGTTPRAGWKESDLRKGYSFRFDAHKFYKQILIPQAASLDMADGDILVWLDGDTVTLKPVPLDFVPGLLGAAEVCYLNRQPKHSEIGFWAVRLNPKVRQFLAHMATLYTDDLFVQLPQWHSAYVWDRAREAANLTEAHLCKPGSRGHVWPTSPLARYLRHDKGIRKGQVK